MKITKVEVRAGKTINLGNYETWRYDIGLTAEVEEDENWERVAEELTDEIKALISSEEEDVLENQGTS